MAYPSAPYVTYLIQCFIYSLPYPVPLMRLTESVTYEVLHMKHLTYYLHMKHWGGVVGVDFTTLGSYFADSPLKFGGALGKS